jgi:hypothetical protein
MSKFIVYHSFEVDCAIVIEAETEDEAEAKFHRSEFDPSNVREGDWTLLDSVEVEPLEDED